MNKKLFTEKLALKLINKYLPGWQFRFIKTKRTRGLCNYTDKAIEISIYHVLHMSLDLIKDVLLHEISHGLCPGDGHGLLWKKKCVELGARPEKDYQSPPLPGSWIAECQVCSYPYELHKTPDRNYVCKATDECKALVPVLMWNKL